MTGNTILGVGYQTFASWKRTLTRQVESAYIEMVLGSTTTENTVMTGWASTFVGSTYRLVELAETSF